MILWTDFFVYLLLVMAIGYGVHVYQSPLLSPRWRQVICRPLNLVACIIILIYSTIAILDSVHFRSDIKDKQIGTSGIVSILDQILKPLALRDERTYSAPFAMYAYTKETMASPDGKVVRDFPRLTYGGAHLKDPSQRISDIEKHFLLIGVKTLILGAALGVLILLWGTARSGKTWDLFINEVLTGKAKFPWKTLIATLVFFLFIILIIIEFMPLYHILGTDQIGEDVLYASLKSVRTGLVIGTITTLVMLPFAILFGIMAGYFRGWIDDIIQYLYTTLSAIPGVLLIAAAVLSLQMVMDRHPEWFQTMMHRADARLLALCAILGLTSWTSLCRLLRGETLKISQIDYVQAAHALGASHRRVIMKHLLPNVFHIILITLALDFSGLVLAEAVLSYVGVGVDPASYSWGTMINTARLEMARDPLVWWNLSSAFVFMFVLVLAANIFADALRDAFDPQAHIEGGTK